MINSETSVGNELHNAVLLAVQHLDPGDVILLEAQVRGPRWTAATGDVGLLPVEWVTVSYDAIRTATANGIIVVEATGNGYQNLDDPIYGGVLSAGGRADSGAIMVGAGHAPDADCGTEPARSRMNYSNYGSRIDVQAWGECVTTTGYGGLGHTSPTRSTRGGSAGRPAPRRS